MGTWQPQGIAISPDMVTVKAMAVRTEIIVCKGYPDSKRPDHAVAAHADCSRPERREVRGRGFRSDMLTYEPNALPGVRSRRVTVTLSRVRGQLRGSVFVRRKRGPSFVVETRLLATVIVIILASLASFAYAVPTDPTWIAGLY